MKSEAGFTMLEMSIVLVIIGLLIGGVMVGRNLIETSAVNSQISQIEKLKTATVIFEGKYGYLPGDIPNPYASNYGFITRGTVAGTGDGNGILEGNAFNTAGNNRGWMQAGGETITFWADLTTAGLINGTFQGTETSNMAASGDVTFSSSPYKISDYFPKGKISGNYIYAYNTENQINAIFGWPNMDGNYFGLSLVTKVPNSSSQMTSAVGLSVAQAYAIDSKVDDGMPMSGDVLATYINTITDPTWAGTANAWTAVAGSAATCFDNNNNAANPVIYTIRINSGNGVNCALSFKLSN